MTKELVMFWNAKAAELFNIHTNPGHDARRMAVIQIAVYDALNAIVQKYKRFTYSPPPGISTGASLEAAVHTAAYTALSWAIEDVNIYNNKLAAEGLPKIAFTGKIEDIQVPYVAKMNAIPDSQAKKNGVEIGKNAALTIILRADSDVKFQLLKIRSSTPIDGTSGETGVFRGDYYTAPGLPNNKLLKDFGEITPFVLNTATKFRQNLNYTPAQRLADFNEVKLKGAAGYLTNGTLKDTVEFWADYRQHIVWNNVAVVLIKRSSMDAWDAARVFALIHTAMVDCTICLFKDLYHFKHWRPITAIRLQPGPQWTPYKTGVPRVPEYPSTFGLLGGAAGEILKGIFAPSGIVPAFNVSPSITYTNINDAVNDNALTKIYCGWNFRKSAENAVVQGRLIGRFVMARAFKR